MSEDVIRLAMIFVIVAGMVSGTFRGLAAIIAAWFTGKASVIRAQRGDPLSVNEERSLPSILGSVLRNRRASRSELED